MNKVRHELKPIYNNNSNILILGTIPSVKSREIGFYYSHPQNRFWTVLADIFNEIVPVTIEEKKSFVIRHNIALWDVLKECDIDNSSDSSIKNPVVNDINLIIENSNIKAIFTTGKKATDLYNKYCFLNTNIKCIYLPSTSPANCSINYDKLKEKYKEILNYL